MKKIISIKQMVLLVIILMALNTAFHFYIRFSEPYSAAIDAYKKLPIAQASDEVSLCFICRKRWSSGSGKRYFEFAIVVEKKSGMKQKFHADCMSSDKGETYQCKL
jgi:hypothetical protein